MLKVKTIYNWLIFTTFFRKNNNCSLTKISLSSFVLLILTTILVYHFFTKFYDEKLFFGALVVTSFSNVVITVKIELETGDKSCSAIAGERNEADNVRFVVGHKLGSYNCH